MTSNSSPLLIKEIIYAKQTSNINPFWGIASRASTQMKAESSLLRLPLVALPCYPVFLTSLIYTYFYYMTKLQYSVAIFPIILTISQQSTLGSLHGLWKKCTSFFVNIPFQSWNLALLEHSLTIQSGLWCKGSLRPSIWTHLARPIFAHG